MAIKDKPKPLMPHAPAPRLAGGTTPWRCRSRQIAEFCGLHILEVQAMADESGEQQI